MILKAESEGYNIVTMSFWMADTFASWNFENGENVKTSGKSILKILCGGLEDSEETYRYEVVEDTLRHLSCSKSFF